MAGAGAPVVDPGQGHDLVQFLAIGFRTVDMHDQPMLIAAGPLDLLFQLGPHLPGIRHLVDLAG